MSDTRNFVYDAGSNYLRMAVSIVGTLLVTRAMALQWGVDQFGRWSLITSVLGFALLLDFGLSNVVLKAAGSSDDESAHKILSSVFLSFLLLSLLAGLVLAAVLVWMLKGGDKTLEIAILLLSVRATIATLPWTVFRSVLYARGKMAASNIAQAANILVYSVIAWWVLCRGGSVAAVAALSLGAGLLDSITMFWMVRRFFPGLKLRLNYDHQAMRPSLSLGGASLLMNVAGFILLKTDPIIVKTFLPIAQVAIYAVALRIAENIFLLCKQLVNALTPHAIRAGNNGERAALADLFRHATRYVLAFGACLYVSSLVLGESAIRLWLSADYSASAVILNILLLAMVLSIPQLVASNLMTFSGKHKKVAKFVTIATVLNVAASVILVQIVGTAGVAYGTLLTTLAIDLTVVVPFACRHFEIRLSSLIYGLLKAVALPAVFQWLFLSVITHRFHAQSLMGVGVQAACSWLVYGVLFVLFGMSAGERKTILLSLRPETRRKPSPAWSEAA
jgi:O-antigen/teichoic acid export membrane protein